MRKYHQTIARRKAAKASGKAPPSKALLDAAILSQAPEGFTQSTKTGHSGGLFDKGERDGATGITYDEPRTRGVS